MNSLSKTISWEEVDITMVRSVNFFSLRDLQMFSIVMATPVVASLVHHRLALFCQRFHVAVVSACRTARAQELCHRAGVTPPRRM